MKLSDYLISQFVKITNDRVKKKTETTLYGTTEKDANGRICVRLDGSDILTPVSNTANIGPNERVMVLIKNHTAIVTGNLTSPSARVITNTDESGNVISKTVENIDLNGIDELKVKVANVETLVAGKASATELDAAEAEIVKLKAEDVKVSGRLDTAEGDIDALESDVASIKELTFGSATGTTISTEFANAVIAQLGNAQIKSAMIESVSADKIAAGDIITNNVRVKSEDGKLLISDETIQISDETRVRVQIGKDSAGDYSINIWDADGKLMFSEGGITDNAIKEAIIRNDMVSDTANISAHKLDIDSLFEEINGSSKTIKSSKIYLDDEKQTLDVAFESLTTDVSDLDSKVTSQGTQITAVQGQIASKIWQQDIDTAVGEVDDKTDTLSTKYSSLEQEVDSISSTVAGHTSEISKKADATTVTAVSSKITSLEQDLSGFKTTVSNTYSTKNDVSAVTQRVSTVEQTAEGLSVSLQQTDNKATEAAKTATNFMSYDATNGLQVGNKSSGSWSGFRTRVTSTTFDILNAAGTVLASYGAKLIELGKGAVDAVISLCGGKGEIKYNATEDYLEVTSDKLRLKGDTVASLYSVDLSDSSTITTKNYTNISDPSNYLTDKRMNSSGTGTACVGAIITNHIPVQNGDIIRIKGINVEDHINYASAPKHGIYVNGSVNSTITANADSDKWTYAMGLLSSDGTLTDTDGTAATYTIRNISASNVTIRFSGDLADGYTIDDVVITKNEEIAETTVTTYSAKKSAVNVESNQVDMYSQESIDYDFDSDSGHWTTSEFHMDPEEISLLSNSITETSRTGSRYETVLGDIVIDPNGNTVIKSNTFISSGEKTAYNDGVVGWYIGADGTMHATRATGGAFIGFHYGGSKNTTASIQETASGVISINGMRFGTNKILWTGGYVMAANQTATLSEAISDQTNGVVLVFSAYSTSTSSSQNYHWSTHFVPKTVVSVYGGGGQTFIMTSSGTFDSFAAKYLYIHDNSIVGNDNNKATGTGACGIKYSNNLYVLRYVIGV